jgi:hypothetical protein
LGDKEATKKRLLEEHEDAALSPSKPSREQNRPPGVCGDTLSDLILGKGKYGMNGQCLTTKARGKWFTPATFEAIEDDLVRRMIAVARKSYDAAVLAEKAAERASAERPSAEGDSEAGTPSTGPDASFEQEES